MGSERSHVMFSSNVKLDRFLRKEKELLNRTAASIRQEISCQQRIEYSKFRQRFLKSEMNHAQLYEDKEEKREIERVMNVEREYGENSIAYRRMLQNRVATAPSVIARTLLTSASAKKRPSRPSAKSARNPKKEPGSQKHDQTDDSSLKTDKAKDSVFLTETNLIKQQTRMETPNKRVGMKSGGELGCRRHRRDSLDELSQATCDKPLREAVTLARYPFYGDAYTRVARRSAKYICRPQEITNKKIVNGVAIIREGELLKRHREILRRSAHGERMNKLGEDVAKNLSADSKDFMGEETMRRVRERKANQVLPTPDKLIERHCGVYARIPRSHTFSNWTIDKH